MTRRATIHHGWFHLLMAAAFALPPAGFADSPCGPQLPLQPVQGTVLQPAGPVHDYRIGQYEITCTQFVAFLNDARANPTTPRGQYLFFHTTTGDVYINSAINGGSGANLGGLTVKAFQLADVAGQIAFDPVAVSYSVIEGYADHPITGVTWYGALKFCNWLTLATGLPTTERCYTEGVATADMSNWRPVTISQANWQTRDLNSTERLQLLGYLGYRLPMDGGTATASLYNEWYKAAAWNINLNANTLYGYGANTISGANANYKTSGDPFDDGTTPVGFYDGINTLTGGTPTIDTANSFGLYDLSGNVWEWMQDKAAAQTGRRTRGGAFNSTTTVLRVDIAATKTASTADNATGFRVVQVAPIPFLITPFEPVAWQGTWGGPWTNNTTTQSYCILNTGAQPTTVTIAGDKPWLGVSQTSVELQVGEQAAVSVFLPQVCDGSLPTGVQQGTVIFEDDVAIDERAVTVTVTEPMSVQPTGTIALEVQAGGTVPASALLTLPSSSQSALQYHATTVELAPWLLINDAADATGTIPATGSTLLTISTSADAFALAPGDYTTTVRITNLCTGTTFDRNVTLTVKSSLILNAPTPVAFGGTSGGPFDPRSITATLSNPGNEPVNWESDIDTEDGPLWLMVEPASGMLAAGGEVVLTLSPNMLATELIPGGYEATLTITDSGSGSSVSLDASLDIADFTVNPVEPDPMKGKQGGPFIPDGVVFDIANTSDDLLIVLVTVVDEPAWLALDTPVVVVADSGSSGSVTASLTASANSLPTGEYLAQIDFENEQTQQVITREVTLVVTGNVFTLAMKVIPATHAQPSGPAHDYRMATQEISNAAYVQFLNSVLTVAAFNDGLFIVQPETGRMVLSGDSTVLFDPVVHDDITYINGAYAVSEGREQFPVAGVSWYGAVAFCNWMTRVQGMSDDQLAYAEGPTAANWHPATIAPQDYATRDLNAAERAAMVQRAGFRLPMDDKSTTASLYNEWYKAAAWRNGLLTNMLYGFGRDTIGPADANYLSSGDPHEPDETPRGFYNGINTLANGSPTVQTENGYQLYDLSGNVAEWVQDQGTAVNQRATRGGHSKSAVGSAVLRTNNRVNVTPETTANFIGFRVVQSVLEIPLSVEIIPSDDLPVPRIVTYVGGPFPEDAFTLRIHNESVATLDAWSLSLAGGLLAIDGDVEEVIPAGGSIDVTLKLTDGVSNLKVPPAPVKATSHVSVDDAQPDGPAHDYWIAPTEVTNADFAAFLTSVLNAANSEEPSEDVGAAYVFFDSETGVVYLHDDVVPTIGVATPGVHEIKLYDPTVGRILWQDGAYDIEEDFEQHPVVGVSWYGATKYCNWLTISQGMDASLRVYLEASSSNVAAWQPVYADPQQVVDRTIGYRLPMDGGGADEPEVGGASSFNEWFKAAAWDRRFAVNRSYGFGRDELTNADANYEDSSDPFDNGTSPVAFYNGISVLIPMDEEDDDSEAVLTEAGENRYSLFDLTGNVREWMHDPWDDSIIGPESDGTVRGGSWQSAVDDGALQNDQRQALAAGAVDAQTGFRVVRGTGFVGTVEVENQLSDVTDRVAVTVDLREPLLLAPPETASYVVPYGTTLTGLLEESYTLANRSAMAMPFTLTSSVAWLELLTPLGTSGSLPGLEEGEAYTLSITAKAKTAANLLAPDDYQVRIEATNTLTNSKRSSWIDVCIEPPIMLTPDESTTTLTMYFGGSSSPPSATWVMQSDPDAIVPVQFVASENLTWLTLSAPDGLTGTVAPGSADRLFTITPSAGANLLPVGSQSGSVTFDFTNTLLPAATFSVTRQVKLEVVEPLTIEQGCDAASIELAPDAPELPVRTFLLKNNSATVPIDIALSLDAEWLALNDAFVSLLPGQSELITVNVTEAYADVIGSDMATLTMDDLTTGESVTCDIGITLLANLAVSPTKVFAPYVSTNGTATPPMAAYTIFNLPGEETGTMNWTVQFDPPVAWLSASGGAQAQGTLEDDSSVTVIVGVQPTIAATLPPGAQPPVMIRFIDSTTGEVVTRQVVLTVVNTLTDPLMMPVAAVPMQPAGPTYAFETARLPVTNATFAVFLNDALLNLNDPRGQYLFFETTTGRVYLNSMEDGQSGPDKGELALLVFDPAIGNAVTWNGTGYSVVAGRELHPVVGVSWYGAVKFANWMTLDQGLSPDARCYLEDIHANPQGWRPKVISEANWQVRDLNHAERLALVTSCYGYRLPMDEGSDNADFSQDNADTYNEWYKAAAWNPNLKPAKNMNYGFGRDTIGPVDANYKNSGDPFDNGTSPVGYFDGINPIGAGVSSNTSNPYGLYDMSGNVFQWMQDRYSNVANNINFRAMRGGSWNSPASGSSLSLENKRRTFAPTQLAHGEIGIRLVRVPVAAADFDQNGKVNLVDWAILMAGLSGPNVPPPFAAAQLDLDGDGDADLKDAALLLTKVTP